MSKRILWMFNHTSLRKFEVPILISMGYEVYCPKIFDVGFGDRSASITSEYDSSLTIPEKILIELNQTNLYRPIDESIMDLLNQHFDIVFCMAEKEPFKSLLYGFRGVIVLHVFGLPGAMAYTGLLEDLVGPQGLVQISRLGNRFYFSQTYDNLAKIEASVLQKRAIYMPIGLGSTAKDKWQGGDKRFLFVGPKIKTNSYYRAVYEQFCKDFGDIPHVISGGQIIPVTEDPTVTGFLPWDEYVYNMTHLSCMYYHSQNPRHLHYHPLEAIQYGMPLVYMAGGMLDHLGGDKLPGRCKTVAEARQKIQRLANGDRTFAEKIRNTQRCLLEPFTEEFCRPYWEEAMEKISASASQNSFIQKEKKIAVVLPAAYTGGVLDYAYRFCKCIAEESARKNDLLRITFAYPDNPLLIKHPVIRKLRKTGIRTEAYRTKEADALWIHRQRVLQGIEKEENRAFRYSRECVLLDGKKDFTDYDYVFVMSDLSPCEAPIYWSVPHAVVAHDYIQRYVPHLIPHTSNQIKLENQRRADHILVTSEPAQEDAVNYAGINREKVFLTPYMLQLCETDDQKIRSEVPKYFLWSTNAVIHKNHLEALEALEAYYQSGGFLKCVMTGTNTQYFRKEVSLENAPVDRPYVEKVRAAIQHSDALKKNIKIRGNLPKAEYFNLLRQAQFLFHPGYGDNGNGSVFDAAGVGVPAVVSDYPSMRYMEKFMRVPVWHFDPYSSASICDALSEMEEKALERKKKIPGREVLKEADYRYRAEELYQTVRKIIGL